MILSCSAGGQTIGMVTQPTSTECYAENIAFLTSVAWCTHVQCDERQPSADLLEYWWEMQITGQKTAGARTVPAKWTYGQALAQVTEEPTLQLHMTDTSLNTTSLVPLHKWHAQYNVLYSTQEQGARMNKYGSVTDQSEVPSNRHNRGLTFFVKKGAGFTGKLQAHTNLLTLVEGAYPNNSTSQVLRCDRLLLIAGGIGITAIVPFVANHWNAKLSWSVRDKAECLVNELTGVLDAVGEKDVRVGSRLDIPSLLAS